MTVAAIGESQHRRALLGQPGGTTLTFDARGNCYANDRPLAGRCVRFSECKSAVYAWQQLGLLPVSCQWTPYDHFVCCPHGGYELPRRLVPPSEQICSEAYRRQPGPRTLRQPRGINHASAAKVFPGKAGRLVKFVAGGKPTRYAEFPYMCALGWRLLRPITNNEYAFKCGGVLIAPQYVLTVAHCTRVGGESPSVALIGGVELNNSRAGELINIQRITPHPYYDGVSSNNDLALVRLERNAYHSIACLWRHGEVPLQPLTALGYGQTKFAGPASDALLQVQLYPLDNRQCALYFRASDALNQQPGPGQLCAGDNSGRMDTCQGDSGGPLILHQQHGQVRIPYIIGLTSFGGSCATGAPGIYTRLAHYVSWIENQIWRS
ncbi:serine protease snake [Scaptodrosophila lebanonensis]|uniref:Serine protease snake n=1 Tax=Drosophila lebanonensis TaxID=7225 RepID=A0A6J2T0G5_DROLE|nr:serine protease snake [Scaptodrosophila lebanonensis]